jgi:TrmH family RNA methyltransferase
MFHPLTRSEERLIRALHRRKQREAEGLFLAEGVRLCEELLASALPIRFAVVAPSLKESERGSELLASLEARTTVRRVDERALEALAATQSPQGVLAVASAPQHSLETLALTPAATLLVLDGVQDPGNFGTLVRSADALGAAGVVALPGTVDPWNPKAVRAAAGASFRIPVFESSLEALRDWMHQNGFTVYGADAAGVPVDRAELAHRAALIVGNEGAGLAPDTLAATDALLAVPIEPHAESLNVAVAAGILLFLLTRRR